MNPGKCAEKAELFLVLVPEWMVRVYLLMTHASQPFLIERNDTMFYACF
jgi:hypothetical protein